MYEYANRYKFYKDKVDIQYLIEYKKTVNNQEVTVTLTNADIVEDTFEHYEGVMSSESLTFANGIASYISFETRCEDQLYQRWLMVKMIVDNDNENPIPIGTFYVAEDNMSFDKTSQSITAYDALYLVINSDPELIRIIYDSMSFPITVKDFRDTFFSLFDIEQGNEFLINDDIYLPKQLSDDDVITGHDVVKAIAEINGVFPRIGKDGLLHWITLDKGDIFNVPCYPQSRTYPSSVLYPGIGYRGQYVEITKDQYEEDELVWSNFVTIPIDGVQIRNEANSIVYISGNDPINPYTIMNNFMCYGLSQGQYQEIADKLLDQIKYIIYIPIELSKLQDPCLEPGDRVLIHGKSDLDILTYIFNKTTSDIQVAFEKITTNGTYLLEQYDVDPNVAKIKNLDNRVGNMEKAGSGALQIVSVATLPANPQLNVLYLIQGEVVVE